MLLLGLLATLWGFLMVISPQAVYYIAESWKSRQDAEPSASYKVVIRISGVICACAGVATCIGSFFV